MKIIKLILVVLYIYVVTFGIFINDYFQIPAPLILGFPLVFLFKDTFSWNLLYTKEVILIAIAMFLYYVLGLSQFNSFAANIISVAVCAAFFNDYVADDRGKFNTAVIIFYLLLALSSVVMIVDHYQDLSSLRASLIGAEVIQSPTGIAQTKFTFGYHLAALTPFLCVATSTFKKPVILQAAILIVCLVLILFGLQRSVFVAFLLSIFSFIIIYYRFKAALFAIGILACCYLIYTYYMEGNLDGVGNIITKSENQGNYNDRSNLMIENLKIFANYPYGLIFYGKSWSDVVYRDAVFYDGITSHNAYIMFITYLGPFLGFGLLYSIYARFCKIFFEIIKVVREKENALMVGLCFSFLGVSINSLSHNDWLISANGPTIFLFFSILHLYKITQDKIS